MAAIKISTAARNAACDAIVDLIDGGSGAGVLRIYTGAQPATPGTAPTGTLLAEVTLNDPAFGSAAAGVAALTVSPAISDASANATGTAGWCRFLDSTEAAGSGLGVVDGAVTASAGGGFLELATTTVTAAGPVSITSGSITVPAS